MSAPTLWGIDPTQVYKWTPSEFRTLKAGWKEREAAITPTEEALKDPAVAKKYAEDMQELAREFMAAPRGVKAGAPILTLAPLKERTALRLQSARALYERALWWAKEHLAEDADKIRKSSMSQVDQDAAIRELERKATMENVKRGVEAYSEDLREDVLRESVTGWENFRGEFGPSWMQSFASKPEWLNELFIDIVAGSVFTEHEQEGFTLPPVSV